MLVSGIQQSDSVIHIQVSILFQVIFPFRLLQNIEQSSLCYTVGTRWLSILNIQYVYGFHNLDCHLTPNWGGENQGNFLCKCSSLTQKLGKEDPQKCELSRQCKLAAPSPLKKMLTEEHSS